MNSIDQDHDDLTVIKGIGPVRQRWFNESLGVFTYRDLSALSVDVIESRLKTDNQIASLKTIEGWIAEAQEFAKAAKPQVAQNVATENSEAKQQVNDTVEENNTSSHSVNANESEDEGEVELPIRNDGWKPFASFVIEFQERSSEDRAVEFRTAVHHMEADTSRDWPGIERDKHCQWMLEQLGVRISKQSSVEEKPAQEDIVKKIPFAKSPLNVEIAHVRAYQPPRTETPVLTGESGQSIEGILIGNQPFVLEIRFEIVGDAAVDLTTQPAFYRARAYVQDDVKGENIQLGDAEPGKLVEGELSYSAKFPEVALPPGRYILFAFVNLQAASVKPDFVTFSDLDVTR